MRASPILRLATLALVLFIAGCGGSNDDGNTATAPLPTAKYAPIVPVTAVVTLDGSASTASSGGTLSYGWVLNSRPTGSTATITGSTAVQAHLTVDVVGAYGITLTVSDGVKSGSVQFSITALAYTTPTILADLVEPVSGVVHLSLSSDQGTSVIAWTVDGVALASGATVTWDTSSLADGNHIVVAQVQSTGGYAVVSVSRTFQVMQTPVSFTSATISESAGAFTAIVGAQSVNGILRVDATLDGVALGSLVAPNACTDPTGVACASTGPNGFSFGGTVGSGQHVVVVTATDGTARQLGTQLPLNVTDVP